MKTVFFESLRYKLITKNDFYYGSCPDILISIVSTQAPRNAPSCQTSFKRIFVRGVLQDPTKKAAKSCCLHFLFLHLFFVETRIFHFMFMRKIILYMFL